MQYPQFGSTINLGNVDLASANTDTSGGGTINVLLTGASKFASITVDNTTNLITCSNWFGLSDIKLGIIKNGDVVSLASTGGIPTGLALNTDYQIINFSLNTGTDIASFQLLAVATQTIVTFTTNGTTPHVMRFPLGTRVDQVEFINSQIASAVSSANVGKLFMKPRNSSTWFPIREVLLPAATRSTSVMGNRQVMAFAGGLFIPEGAQLGATIAVYAGVQDRTSVFATQSTNF